MPSFSNFRKRASASLDAYTASAAAPLTPQHQQPQTRAQRALSRLSRLKIPRRPSQADFSSPFSSSFSRAQTPISPVSTRPTTPWQHQQQQHRPNKLRRQSRSLSVSTVLAFSSASSPSPSPAVAPHTSRSLFAPPPALLEQQQQEQDRLRRAAEHDVERLKRTISYPILNSSTAVDIDSGTGWGVREAKGRLECTVRRGDPTKRPSTALSKRNRSNTLSSSGGLAFPSLGGEEEDEVDDPFAPYTSLAKNTSGALNLSLDLDLDLDLDVSFDSIGGSTFSSSSLSSYGNSGGEEEEDRGGLTSRFSTSTASISSPPSERVPAWRESDDSLAEVDLDFEAIHSDLSGGIGGFGGGDFPSSSPTLYKHQPSVSSPSSPSSVPPTPTSPLSPFPRSLKSKPSIAWSTWTTSTSATSVNEDVQAGRGFSFARTSPTKQPRKTLVRSVSTGSFASRGAILPTPPPTPRLEPVYEDSPSFLALPEAGVGSLSSRSDLSLFLDELAGELEKVQERDEEMETTDENLYGGNHARRSSIPFPSFDQFSRSPAPSPSPPLERCSTPAPSYRFPLMSIDTPPRSSPSPFIAHTSPEKKRHSSAPFPFSLDSPPPTQHRKRVLRRVPNRIDVVPFTPPSSTLDTLLDTPTKSRFPPSAGFLGAGQAQYSPLSSATATPRPSTPRLTIVDAPGEIAFPLLAAPSPPSSPLASPTRQRALVVPDEEDEDVDVEHVEDGKQESWTMLPSAGEGGRRRSF